MIAVKVEESDPVMIEKSERLALPKKTIPQLSHIKKPLASFAKWKGTVPFTVESFTLTHPIPIPLFEPKVTCILPSPIYKGAPNKTLFP